MDSLTKFTPPFPPIAVIGCGRWGANHIRTASRLGALAAVADSNLDAAMRAAQPLGVPALTPEAAIAHPDIQGLVIATPAPTHADLAVAALMAGKHVLIEKPLAMTATEAERIGRAAAKSGKVAMVGHLLRYHPAFKALQAMLADGRLGKVRAIRSTRLNIGRVRHEEDAFRSLAPHDVSMVLALAGAEPIAVEAWSQTIVTPGIADMVTARLIFADGVEARIEASWLHPVKEQRLILVGDRGMAVFDDAAPWDAKLIHYPHRVKIGPNGPETLAAEGVPVLLSRAEPLTEEISAFLSAIQDGTPGPTDLAEGMRVMRVLDQVQAAIAPPTRSKTPTSGFTLHPTATVDEGAVIGEGTRIWHFSHILGRTRIGRDCTIGQNVAIGPDVTVGDRCKIQNNVSLYAGVELEDGVFCGPSAVFTNVNTPRAEVERKSEFRPTRVGRGATIGANATIVCGHALGAYSFVAAGAVVTRDVPPHALVAGNPARRIGWVSHAGERLGPDLTCPRTGRRYQQTGPDTLVEMEEVSAVA